MSGVKASAELLVVLNNPVVDYGYVPVAVEVRVGILLIDLAVCGPADMADSSITW